VSVPNLPVFTKPLSTRPLLIRGVPLAAGRLPAVCVPLLAASEARLLRDAERAMAAGADLLEWRADFFDSLDEPLAVTTVLERLREALPKVPLLFTIRSAEQGGEPRRLTSAQWLSVQRSVIDSQAVDFLDLELVLGTVVRDELVERCRAKSVPVIFSQHDFQQTPALEVIESFFHAAKTQGGAAGKVAVMPQSAADVLTLLAATLRASSALDMPLISMAMGPLGLVSRVFGAEFGSALTFAALEHASAPGQLAIGKLRSLLDDFRA